MSSINYLDNLFFSASIERERIFKITQTDIPFLTHTYKKINDEWSNPENEPSVNPETLIKRIQVLCGKEISKIIHEEENYIEAVYKKNQKCKFKIKFNVNQSVDITFFSSDNMLYK